MAGDDILLVFGSQALSFSPAAFKEMRSAVWDNHEQAWILDLVASLPDCWDDFARAFPKFAVIDPGARHMLVDMHRWFREGDMPAITKIQALSTGGTSWPDWALPNMILSPLVIISQLVECMQFLDMTTASGSGVKIKGTLGFCTGLLSAVAASLSKDKSQVRSYGAKAVRLAMLIGAVVDAQEILDAAGPARALTTAWTTDRAEEDELHSILKQTPGVSAFPQKQRQVKTDTRFPAHAELHISFI
jgi:hypothetical protein